MSLHWKINYQKLQVTGENENALHKKLEFMRASVRMYNRLACTYFVYLFITNENLQIF